MKTWEDEVSTLSTLALGGNESSDSVSSHFNLPKTVFLVLVFRRMDGPARWPGNKGKAKNSCLCQRYINSLVTQLENINSMHYIRVQ
jgi:hypothetical protein